jgi:carbon monoxide dehydrogenase subunit G
VDRVPARAVGSERIPDERVGTILAQGGAMQIQNDFVVDAPVDRVWNYVLDVTKVAPCMPGAELTETVDDTTWKGKMAIKLGPVSMSFSGTVKMTERDDASHHVVLKADGREQRGRGAASALVTTDMAAADGGGTKVAFVTDLTITGAAAQYGRGMIQDVSAKLTGEFASCLQANISAEETAARAGEAATAAAPAEPGGPATAPPRPVTPVQYTTAKPVKGIRLGLWALWQSIVRFFKRLFGGGRRSG